MDSKSLRIAAAIGALLLLALATSGCRRRARYASQAGGVTCPSGAICPAGTICGRDEVGEVCLPDRNASAATTTHGAQCRKHHECLPGQRCDKWTRGVRMCMGEGNVGAPCRKHRQCLPGLRCVRRSPDRLTVCMNPYQEQAPPPPPSQPYQPQLHQHQLHQHQASPPPAAPYPPAPPVGQPPSPTPHASQPGASRRADWDAATQGYPYCTSGIDCGHGSFCRDRGDGVLMCMGQGPTGAPCASGIDCSSGLFCKDRGDGLHLCMGKGQQGAFCSSGIDCNPGLFCKDPGDGLTRCM